MTPTDAQPAESSPAAEPVSGQALIDSFTPTERDTWQKSGDLPERVTVTTSDDKPDSSPDQPADQAASTDASTKPASEPGKPKGEKLKARNAQLDAENNALQEKLRIRHALREELARTERPKQDATPDSSSEAKPTASEWQRYSALPGAPNEQDFESYAEFTAAQALFLADQRWNEHESRAREHGQQQEHQDGVRRMADEATARVRKHMETDPTFEDSVDTRLLAIPPVSVLKPGAKIGPHNVIAEEIAKSPVTAHLLKHFSTDQGREDWRQLMTMPPTDLLRAFGRLEARFDTDAPAAASPKHLSSAPAPATVLGARPADTADPAEKAAREKDVTGYINAANKAALASLRR